MIDYHVVKNWVFDEVRYSYSERDCMLYALGVGLGCDPEDARQLRYVYEADLHAMPTMATVMGAPGAWWKDPRTGADAVRLVHGEQHMRFHRPLPVGGTLLVSNRVQSLTDKGPGKGALGVVVREIRDEQGVLLAESRNVSVLRGDGGFSADSGISDPPPEPLAKMPERAPDIEVDLVSLAQMALIYRLSGDYNPLHADPAVAAKAGFPRPILHGLATYGMAAHAVLRECLDYDASRLRGLAVRFTAPVYPGETVRIQLWRESAELLRLRARVESRDVTVLDQGTVEIAA
ncbi:MAG: MaoC/PaaZ C-terminal domain-containing protein [Pseudomonas sp.]|uniref:MaoC/PaaZ C-terminal domain-containing protein n=1 Tax=Pseudomonas sp. TaxID=306 RepID=UPI0039824B84